MTRSPYSTERTLPVLALVAHDEKKDTLTDFCVRHRQALEGWELIATSSTGEQVSEATNLPVQCYLSGPEGGDAQIAARVALGEVAAVIFLVDPLNAHPHDPDIQTLQRVCNVHNVPIATNVATAELIVQPKTINEAVT
jgi:methylglyoxal synthase